MARYTCHWSQEVLWTNTDERHCCTGKNNLYLGIEKGGGGITGACMYWIILDWCSEVLGVAGYSVPEPWEAGKESQEQQEVKAGVSQSLGHYCGLR